MLLIKVYLPFELVEYESPNCDQTDDKENHNSPVATASSDPLRV